MTEDILENGVRAARRGDLPQARTLLANAVRQNPESAYAWLWLGRVLDEPDKKKFCFQRALQLDPGVLEVETSRSTQPVPANESTATAQSPNLEPKPATEISASAVIEPNRKALRPTQIHGKKTPSKSFPLLGVLLGVLAGCILIGISAVWLIYSGRLNGLLYPAGQAQAGLETTLTMPVMHKLPPTWTLTPQPTLAPTYTPTVKPSATIAVTLDAEQKQKSIELLFKMAIDKVKQGLNQDAIVLWDKIIDVDPNYAEAYYQRGSSYNYMKYELTDQSEYVMDMNLALADFDQAISLGPVRGDYFYRRGQVYEDMGIDQDYNVDRQPLFTAAFENMRVGQAMGTTIKGVERDIPYLLNHIGKCDQGLAVIKRLFEAQPPDTPPDPELNFIMSLSYLCLGQYDQALTHINAAMAIKTGCDYYYYKTEILYSLNRLDEANKVITGCINGSPDYAGWRYFLRALIEYDQGQPNKAREDLDIGYGNTWDHGGIYALMRGRLAVDDGDKEKAILMLQNAAATIDIDDSPKVKDRIRSELASLGLQPLSPTQSVSLHTTPISPEGLAKLTLSDISTPVSPQAPIAVTPTQEGNPVPVGYLDAIQVDFADGTGPLTLKPNDYPLFHLSPGMSIGVQRAKKLVFYLDSPAGQAPTNEKLPIQVYMFARGGGWRMIDPQWGENVIDFPSFYIGPSGDFYVAIRNWSPTQTIKIGNAGFVVTVVRTDGDDQTYGLAGK
jgi:tetratricopeptide (TPR) repeat protein